MAVQAIFEFKNADSTLDLNNRFNGLFSRGIFYGGTVSPGSGLSISISPFFAVSYDGMVLREESVSTTLTVSAGIKSYIVLRAKYSGSEVPTLSFESIGSSAYLIDPDKNYLIVFATVTLAASVTSVVVGNIKTSERDIIDKIVMKGNINEVEVMGHIPINHLNIRYELNSRYSWIAKCRKIDAF